MPVTNPPTTNHTSLPTSTAVPSHHLHHTIQHIALVGLSCRLLRRRHRSQGVATDDVHGTTPQSAMVRSDTLRSAQTEVTATTLQ